VLAVGRGDAAGAVRASLCLVKPKMRLTGVDPSNFDGADTVRLGAAVPVSSLPRPLCTSSTDCTTNMQLIVYTATICGSLLAPRTICWPQTPTRYTELSRQFEDDTDMHWLTVCRMQLLNKYVGPPYCLAKMYAGRVLYCPFMSHVAYAPRTL